MDKTMEALFEGLGHLAATFQAYPVGACLLVMVGGLQKPQRQPRSDGKNRVGAYNPLKVK